MMPEGTKTGSIIIENWLEDGTYRLVKVFSYHVESEKSDFYLSSNEFEVR